MKRGRPSSHIKAHSITFKTEEGVKWYKLGPRGQLNMLRNKAVVHKFVPSEPKTISDNGIESKLIHITDTELLSSTTPENHQNEFAFSSTPPSNFFDSENWYINSPELSENQANENESYFDEQHELQNMSLQGSQEWGPLEDPMAEGTFFL